MVQGAAAAGTAVRVIRDRRRRRERNGLEMRRSYVGRGIAWIKVQIRKSNPVPFQVSAETTQLFTD